MQILTNSMYDIDDWAKEEVGSGSVPKSDVRVFALEERQIALLTKKGKPE